MKYAPIPNDVPIVIEVGRPRPDRVDYAAREPFEICWVIVNGDARRKYISITRRKTGLYVAHWAPGGHHTTYHADGKRHIKRGDEIICDLQQGLPLDNISGAFLLDNATTAITDEALAQWQLSDFRDEAIDRILYLDNRKLPSWVQHEIWLVEPFRHDRIRLMVHQPVHFHLITHTLPWIAVLIYEPVDTSKVAGTNSAARQGS